MVERSEQENGLGAIGRKIEPAGVSLRDRSQCDPGCFRARSRLLQMKFHGIDEVNCVSLPGKRKRIGSRRAAYIENNSRWRRQMSGEDRLGS